MFKTIHLDFRNAGVLNPLVLDYLEKKPHLGPFYDFFPDPQGFSELLKTGPYADFDRQRLVGILKAQSGLVGNTSEASLRNLEKLGSKQAWTVTTGHQLCLFTGP